MIQDDKERRYVYDASVKVAILQTGLVGYEKTFLTEHTLYES